MNAKLLDTKTNKTVWSNDDINSWQWAEDNWSCDCNRWSYFDDDVEEPEGCEAKRYLVIDAIFNDSDTKYTLKELNHFYPPQLVEDKIKASFCRHQENDKRQK